MDKVAAALDVLQAHGITPDDELPDFPDFPEIGTLADHETVYATSLDAVFGDEPDDAAPDDEAAPPSLAPPALDRRQDWGRRLSAPNRHGDGETL
ncbi:MAG: hypothetical protein KGJ41_17480 [Rhodospirillales bacterium]|nr:hypothetical protein [Rhodospirillales bacterium]MDE2575821.1 hypothetical protein [Rhodospirillales bacterium]